MSFMARKSTNSNVNEIKTNGHSIVDSTQELAETFNYHFGSVGPKLASFIPNGDSSHLEYLDLNLDDENCLVLKKQTDVATVYSLLSKLGYLNDSNAAAHSVDKGIS